MSERQRSPRWPDWTGETVVCIATGPSLTPQQVAYAHNAHFERRCKAIAVNEAGLRQYLPLAAPWAEILYAADRRWWEHYLPDFYGLRVSGEIVEKTHTYPLVVLQRGEPMPTEPGSVVSGNHSGFQALGLALTLGARKIILLGYDAGGGKGRNCHVDRPEKFKRDVNMATWLDAYDRVPREFPDAEVLNCSAVSHIRAFPKVKLEDVL